MQWFIIVAVARESGCHANKSVPIKLVNRACLWISKERYGAIVDTPPDAQAEGEEGDQRR